MSLRINIPPLTRYLLAIPLLGMLLAFSTTSTAYALTKAEFKDVLCEGLQGPGAEEGCRQAANDGVAVITRACQDGEDGCNGGLKSRTVKLSDWSEKSKAEFQQNIDEWRSVAFEKDEGEGCGGLSLNILKCDTKGGNPVTGLVLQLINFLAVGVGIAVVGGIIWGGMMYASSNGDSNKTKQGISIIVNAVIGLLLFIFMYAILNFIVPGGLFN